MISKFRTLYSQIVTEKYYDYTSPKDKETELYDFYVLNYLLYLLDQPSKNFRDLNPDIEDSVRDAATKLFLKLKEQLLYALFFAVCAEFRHVDTRPHNRNIILEKYKPLFKAYLRYYLYYQKDMDTKQALSYVFDVRKPSSNVRIPEPEKSNPNDGYKLSYKAANYALGKTGMDIKDFMEMAKYAFLNGAWGPNYGGSSWAEICDGWQMLNDAEKIDSKVASGFESNKMTVTLPVAIDHVYDLQHNTDTVFNKLKEYYKSGYGWIEKALDDKANVKNYFELLKKSSLTVKKLAPPVLYNKLGKAWEGDIKKTSPTPTSSNQHNPENLTPEQVGVEYGWRLLDKDETGPKFNNSISLIAIEGWNSVDTWNNTGNRGNLREVTYRTKLSKEDLAIARGLKPKKRSSSFGSNVHNPDGLTPEQVGIKDGYRVLDKDETGPKFNNSISLRAIEGWNSDDTWDKGYRGNLANVTYRTKLTREQLAAKRGLTKPKRRLAKVLKSPTSLNASIDIPLTAHNPAKLNVDQIGISKGYRLLDEDEICSDSQDVPLLVMIELWSSELSWMKGAKGNDPLCTYRTKLTKAELKAKRDHYANQI